MSTCYIYKSGRKKSLLFGCQREMDQKMDGLKNSQKFCIFIIRYIDIEQREQNQKVKNQGQNYNQIAEQKHSFSQTKTTKQLKTHCKTKQNEKNKTKEDCERTQKKTGNLAEFKIA